MDEFQIINRYKRLAARDGVPPLVCGICGRDLVVRLAPDDSPMLRCYMCGTTSTVGAKRLLEMSHEIERYDRERK